jgi:hypothetical protein
VRGELPSTYGLQLSRSRRNSSPFIPSLTLRDALDDIGRKLATPFTVNPTGVRMIAGVRLNGRPFKQGDCCVYLPTVRARGNLPGVGGRDGVATSHRIGLINMFYTFTVPQGDVTFVSIYTLPTIHKLRDLYVTNKFVRLVQPGLAFDYDEVDHVNNVLIHIDSISSKLFITPHFDPAQRRHFMCGIPMWDAR